MPKHAELEALELDDQHSRRLLHCHALGSPHFALLLGADVLVGTVQVLRACEALQSSSQVTGPVDLQAEVQEGVVGVGLMPTFCAFHLQQTTIGCNTSPSPTKLVPGGRQTMSMTNAFQSVNSPCCCLCLFQLLLAEVKACVVQPAL